MNWSVRRIDSKEGNVCKFVYTKDDAVAESVLYKYPSYEERTVICCSTQSGCPVGCRFCGAGDHFVRSLSASEIIEQVEYSIKQTGVDPKDMKRLQIMFMSMGEPLLALGNLSAAINYLYAHYPNAKLLISTIGPRIDYRRVLELAEEVPTVGLQFSVHEPTDEARNKLIPFKAKLTLKGISQQGEMFKIITGRKPFFNYCASDHNTGDADADKLARMFRPETWEATVSVICERNDGLPAKNEYQQSLATMFSEKLLKRGYNVRVFDPAGQDDIGGGCGQLWFVQDWMKQNSDKARPSCGNGLTQIHVPEQV